MSNIITFHGKEPVVSNFALAQGFGLDVRSINKLITSNIKTLSKWGSVSKEVGAISNHSKQGGHNKISYLLNEQQAMYIMTYTRKTDKTDQFRIDLINSFTELRKRASSVIELLNAAEARLDKHQADGSGWGKLGVQLKKEKPLVLEAVSNARKLAQLELNLEVK